MVLDILFRPFDDPSFMTVVVWYLGTLIAQMVVALGFSVAGMEIETSIADMIEALGVQRAGFFLVGLGPVLEELVFRGIPYVVSGSFESILTGTVVWTVLHGKRMLAIAPTIPIYVKLWAGGHPETAILVHVVHNALLFCLVVMFHD